MDDPETSLRDGAATVIVTASVTSFRAGGPSAVGVCGSHGGVSAVAYGARAGLVGLVVNDAGVGRRGAGVAGLAAADGVGFAAVAVSYLSARIGDGDDTLASGIVSTVNATAAAIGVRVGMSAAVAADHLRWGIAPRAWPEAGDAPRKVVKVGDIDVLCADSAASVLAEDRDRILVSGSHGGLVGGRTLVGPVRAAFFNDAGRGKDDAGIARVFALETEGVPAAAVAHSSAMIGDSDDTFGHGVVSVANELARRRGVQPDMTVRDAISVLVSSFRGGGIDGGARPSRRE